MLLVVSAPDPEREGVMHQIDAPAPILCNDIGHFEGVSWQFADKEFGPPLSIASGIDLFFLTRISGKSSRAEFQVRLHRRI